MEMAVNQTFSENYFTKLIKGKVAAVSIMPIEEDDRFVKKKEKEKRTKKTTVAYSIVTSL